MAEKSNRFPFSEARVRDESPPAKGRAWFYDTKTPCLCLCKTAAGAASFYFYKWHDGKPMRVLLGKFPKLTVKQAQDAAREMIGAIAKGSDPAAERRKKRKEPTLRELHTEWMIYARTRPEKPKGKRSLDGDKQNFDKHCGPLESRRLGSIRKGDIEKLHRAIGEDRGRYAANRVLALLKAMYYYAIEADDIAYSGANPCCGVQKFTETARDRFLQQGEAEAFFKALNAEEPVFRDFFLVSLLTGARKSNVLSMRWVDVDLAVGYWRIPQTKAGTPVVVPLVAPVLAILEKRRQSAYGNDWVFPGHRRGDHLRSPKHSWERILASAKLTDLRPHDLRRSLGSWMACQNISLPIIGKVLGHKTPQATAIYARLSVDPQRQAMDAATSAMLTAGGAADLLTINAEVVK
jgi:integrase